MDRFDRQWRIPGWDQQRIGGSRVLVCGRDSLGAFVVWGLASLGVGEILWVGRPRRATRHLSRRLLSHQFDGTVVLEFPFTPEYGPELGWAIAGGRLDAVLCCTEDRRAQALCQAAARGRGAYFLAASTVGGGWLGADLPPRQNTRGQPPLASMALAGLLVDAVRELACPLWGGIAEGGIAEGGVPAPAGALGLAPPEGEPSGLLVLVGVGGIGVYAAALAAALGFTLRLVDSDHVEERNLNRRGLFTAADARRREFKAEAARRALARLFPGTEVTSEVCRVADGFQANLEQARPVALLSAVDNAAARLFLSRAGAELGCPVVQGGTDVFAADCYTQVPGGRLLDEQMYGALSAAEARETPRTEGPGCAAEPSYVVPGMLAGALVMHRALQVTANRRELPPIRWRSGSLPVEERGVQHGFDFSQIVA